MNDLTKAEQENVRLALEYLRVRCQTWDLLAKALRFRISTVRRVCSGLDVPSVRLAFRVARLAEVSVDDVLAGRWPDTCPHCGQRKPGKPSAQ